jgi:hypothetical protein
VKQPGNSDVSRAHPHTLSVRRMQRDLAEERPVVLPEGAERPLTRGDCAGGERPCPWVGCRHHLFLDVDEDSGSIKLNFPDLEPDQLVDSCALDVADRAGATLDQVGGALNLTRERVRQIEQLALRSVRNAAAEFDPRARPPPAGSDLPAATCHPSPPPEELPVPDRPTDTAATKSAAPRRAPVETGDFGVAAHATAAAVRSAPPPRWDDVCACGHARSKHPAAHGTGRCDACPCTAFQATGAPTATATADSDPNPFEPPAQPAGVTCELEWITPEMAAAWLENNPGNRRVSPGRVSLLARALATGRFAVNGEAIKLDAAGAVLDGQHRLSAIVAANQGAWSYVVRGLPREVRPTIDRHRPRSDAEELRERFSAGRDAVRAVALVKMISLIRRGRVEPLSFADVETLLELHEEGVRWALEAADHRLLTYAPVAAALALAHPTDPDRLAEFTDRLRTGVNLHEGDPALVLRAFLLERDRVRADPRRTVSLRVLRAVQAHLDGERLLLIRPAEEALEFFLKDRA